MCTHIFNVHTSKYVNVGRICAKYVGVFHSMQLLRDF